MAPFYFTGGFMAQYDGSIRINTKIDTKGFKDGEKEIESESRRMAESVSKTTDQIEKELENLKNAQKSFLEAGGKKASPVYQQYEKEISELQNTLQSLKNTQNDTEIADEHWNLLRIDVEEYAKALKELHDQGKFFGDEDYNKVYLAWKNATDAVKTYQSELNKQTESGQAKIAQQEEKAAEKREAAQRRAEEQAEKALQKENARIQKEVENQAKLEAKEAERKAREEARINAIQAKEEAKRSKEVAAIQEQEAEEQRLAEIRENAVVGNQRIVEVMERRKQLAQEISDMEKAGVGTGYQQYDSAVQELAAADQEIKDYNNNINQVKESYSKLGAAAKKAFSTLQSAVSKTGSGLKKLGGFVKSVFSNLTKSAHKSNSSLGTLGSRFKSLALSLLIFNQISKAFNAMISGMKQGFGNLYKEVNGFKSAVDGLKASSLTLKNSFAAAFRPLVEIAIPYIQRAIDAIASLMNIIGQFTAAITGQKTYTKAIKQTTAAIEDENKAQNKQLSGLDKLNNLSSGSGGASDGGGFGEMFEEEVPIESGISDAAEKVKQILSNIFDVFQQAWESKGQSVIDSAKAALASLAEAAKSVGATFYDVFTGGAGFTWLESGLDLLRSMLDVIGSIATAFSNAWNGGSGIEIVNAIFGALTNINNLLASIGDSFSRAFSNGIGTAIWENILGIITGIYNIIGNLAERIAAAWNTAGLGDSIWNGILSIINTVLGTIHNIADSTAAWVENLDFTPLMQSIDTLLQALQPLAENIGAGLEWFWNNVLLPIAGWAIEEAVPTFLNMLAAAIGVLNSVIEVLQPLATWLWENFLLPLGEWTGELIIAAMEKITELLTFLSNWITEHSEAIQALIATVATVTGIFLLISNAGAILTAVLTGIGTVFTILTSPVALIAAAIVALTAVFVELYENCEEFREFIDTALTSVFNDILSPALNYLSGTVLPLVISTFQNLWNNVLVPLGEFIMSILKPVIEILSEVLTALWQDVVVPLAQFIGGVFAKAFEGIVQLFNQTVIPVVNAVIQVLQFLWNNVFAPIVNFLRAVLMPVFKSVFDTIGVIIRNAQKIFEGLIDFIVGIFTLNWRQAWDGIVKIFDGVFGAIKGVINGILGAVEGMANGVINGINFVIGALNGLSFEIPEFDVFGKKLGGTTIGFNIPEISNVSIPRLATGTVVPPNNEFLAVLGDNKREPEVVSPLSTIEQAVENAMRRNGGMGGGEITIKIPVEIDGNLLFELIKKLDLEQYKRTQKPSFQM